MCKWLGFIGDLHGEIVQLNKILVDLPPETHVIQLGDYGIRWLKYAPAKLDPIIPVWFLPGNHEWYPLLRPFEDATAPVEVTPNSWYVPRGYVTTIGGYRIGFLGGAESIDQASRIPEISWWPDESIKYGDVLKLFENVEKLGGIDILLTHTPPSLIIEMMGINMWAKASKLTTSAKMVEAAWQQLGRPKLYCGHMHESFDRYGVRILSINELVLLPAKEENK